MRHGACPSAGWRGLVATFRRQPGTVESHRTQQESPKGRTGQRPIPDGDGCQAAVAAVAAHLAELDEAKQDGDDELWNDICSDGIEVRSAGRRGSSGSARTDGLRPGRPTSPRSRGESKGFGDGDLMGRVGPATLSPEEVVRRLVTLEFESFEEN